MNNEVVWHSKLDGRYEVVVTRTAPYRGELTVSDAGTVIFRQNVGIMYNAVYGPDISDVFAWQQIAAEYVDYRQ